MAGQQVGIEERMAEVVAEDYLFAHNSGVVCRVERYGSRATVSFVSYSDQNSVKIPSKFRKFNQNSSEILKFKD